MQRRRLRTNATGFITPGKVGALLLIAAVVWVGYGLAHQMYVAYRLNQEVQALSTENDRLAAANRGYEAQLNALSRPEGAEEQARLHNYVRPDEKVYVIEAPSSSPTPIARAKSSTSSQAHSSNWWDGILRFLFH